jgi:hypothetical protein
MSLYEYAMRDSLTMTLPDRRIDVYEIAVRPRDPRAARVVGSLFLDRSSADIVRMSLTFTDAAILDRRIERLSVVLENALIEGRFWLPRRQELEVARAGTWLDFPVRGIIRGSWQICCYQINLALDSSQFSGPAIARAPFTRRQSFVWPEPLTDVLPGDIASVSEADVARVQEIAQGLVSRAVLARASDAALSARSLSDFVRYNRVEGLALGVGVAARWQGRWSLSAHGRRGLEDRKNKGRLRIGTLAGRVAINAYAERDFREVGGAWGAAGAAGAAVGGGGTVGGGGDIFEGSTVRNSLAAQEFGSDYTDPYDVSAFGTVLQASALGWRWSLQGEYVRQGALAVHATPARGRFEATVPAWPLEGAQLQLRSERTASVAGGTWHIGASLAGADLEPRRRADSLVRSSRWGRAVTDVRYHREQRDRVMRLRMFAAAAGSDGRDPVPPQALVYLGGPVSGPGYPFHALRARRGMMLHAEYGVRAPFPAIPLARYGRSAPNAMLLPFAHAIGISGVDASSEYGAGWYPSLGVALELFFDILRVEVARGVRDGRWSLTLDLSEGFRSIF